MKKVKKKRWRLKKWVVILFAVVCISALLYSSINLIIRQISLNKNNKLKKELENQVSVVKEEKKDEATGEIIELEKYVVNFDELKLKNPDTVGYLKIRNSNINYVIVKTNNNEYYLKHNFNKEYSSAGWIFADYRNKFDGTDRNIIIYGHSMKDESMFGSMYKLFDYDWLNDKENLDIVFNTPNGDMIYRIFSMYRIEAEDYYITTDFNSDGEFEKFINNLKNRSSRNLGVDVSSSDQIITLSTCTSDLNKRIVIHAKRIS